MRTVPNLTIIEEEIIQSLLNQQNYKEISKKLELPEKVTNEKIVKIIKKFAEVTKYDSHHGMRLYSDWFLKNRYAFFVENRDITVNISDNRTCATIKTKCNLDIFSNILEHYKERYVIDGSCQNVKYNGKPAEETYNIHGYCEYKLTFAPPLQKREKTNFVIESHFTNVYSKHDDAHFVHVASPTGQLILGVQFSDGQKPKSVYFEKRIDNEKAKQLDIPIKIDGNRYFVIIDEPTFHAYYYVRWSW